MVDRPIPRTDEQRSQSNHKSKRFMRWTTCFAFVSKFKKPVTNARRHSRKESVSKVCETPTDDDERTNLERVVTQDDEEDGDDVRKSIDTKFPCKETALSTPTSPVSALSPPPRHAMKERSRSMTPDMPALRPPNPDTFPTQPATLRLSLDVEQHYPALLHSSSSFMLAGDVKLEEDSSGSSVVTCSSMTIHHSNEQKVDSSPDPPSIIDTPPSPLLLPSPPPDAIRRDRHQSMPILNRCTAADNTLQMMDDEDDYRKILDEFLLPSVDTVAATQQANSTKKESREEDPVLPLYTTGSRSMDIGRDKAFYDAVVAGTLHRRPWTQFLRTQQADTDSPSQDRFVYYPPSPNSIDTPYVLDK